uniref:Uncharacterized protein n=1 Tax=Dictyoglomus turgidum TaxID=513050 RepID=A0A7C3WR86_9BACT
MDSKEISEKFIPGRIFRLDEIKKVLENMRIYALSGELEKNGYCLIIDQVEDRAGKQGLVYSWDLYTIEERDLSEWLKGGAYFYSEEELIEDLYDNDVIS